MTKKKKPKPVVSGKTSSSPSSSSSSHTSGENKQASSRVPAGSSPVFCDLKAATVVAGSVTLSTTDLHLEIPVQIGEVEIDFPPNEDSEISTSPSITIVAVTLETPASTSTLVADAAKPESLAPVLSIPSSNESPTTNSALAAPAANPETQVQFPLTATLSDKATVNTPAPDQVKPTDEWVGLFKGNRRGKELEKKGTPFTLPSGEMCVKIPNSVIEKNKKAWECFVIGQFYSDPPAQSLIHNIVNGIWRKQYRDITVSKLEGNAFLFCIPNVSTRNRVIYQRLWQIEGQTMFVAHWEPDNLPENPVLTSAPIWLELRNVPLQFFNEDGLERIASLVGHPKFLHPATANKTDLEVAKVLTLIDPRQPLPDAVNVQFDSGDIAWVTVSSPWMPPVCTHCREIGHTLKRCPSAPKTCKGCNSSNQSSDACPKSKGHSHKKQQRKKRCEPVSVNSTIKKTNQQGNSVAYTKYPPDLKRKSIAQQEQPPDSQGPSDPGIITQSKMAPSETAEPSKANGISSVSEVEPDSSDVPSSDTNSDMEEGQYIPVRTKRKSRGGRGKGPKNN